MINTAEEVVDVGVDRRGSRSTTEQYGGELFFLFFKRSIAFTKNSAALPYF